MTNTDLLKAKIETSGYKIKWLADNIGLSYQGLLNKINNKTDFTVTEMLNLKTILKIDDNEMESIFFAGNVD